MGPRLTIILSNQDFDKVGHEVGAFVYQLPKEVDGFRYYLGLLWPDPKANGTDENPRNISVHSVRGFLQSIIGIDHPPVTEEEWLAVDESGLFDATTGHVFVNRLDAFTQAMEDLIAYYPDSVWKKRIGMECRACCRVDQSSHLHGTIERAWKRGNIIRCHKMFADTCEAIMRLCFLLNRKYAPYSKWLNREFKLLPELAGEVLPYFDRALATTDWLQRENILSDCLMILKRRLIATGMVDLDENKHMYRFGRKLLAEV